MRASLLITLLLMFAFGLGQGMRSLPHGCDTAGLHHEHEADGMHGMHTHCQVCDFLAIPFEPAAGAIIAGASIHRGGIEAASLSSVVIRTMLVEADRGPPSA